MFVEHCLYLYSCLFIVAFFNVLSNLPDNRYVYIYIYCCPAPMYHVSQMGLANVDGNDVG